MAVSVRIETVLIFLACAAGSVPASAQDASTTPFSQSDSRPLKPGANSFAHSQAKKLLEDQGYTDVSTLVNGSDGIWRGNAVKDGRQVDVSVDYQGHVGAK